MVKGGRVAKRILVVDDEPQLLGMLKMRLETSGYEVITAVDGEEGLQKTRDFNPDLIVLDVVMPKISGGEMAAALKEDDKLSKIPIIFLTCLAEGMVNKQSGESIGGNLFIAKPFEDEELISTINKILNK